MTTRTLIVNGTLLTFGAPCRVLEGQALLIEDGRIARIAPRAEIPGPFERVLDATGQVVMPGLVNAHMHFYSTLVRGLGKAEPSTSFQEVLDHLWWRLDRKLGLDDVAISAAVMLQEAVRKGTTTLVDHHASPFAISGSLERIAEAVQASGPACATRSRTGTARRWPPKAWPRTPPSPAAARPIRIPGCAPCSACTPPSPCRTGPWSGPPPWAGSWAWASMCTWPRRPRTWRSTWTGTA
jgi:cytosine/adenosine deaminase-related metal-dependent hydrolase